MRKRPQQQRSKQMVGALIDATAHCIATHGLDGTTTPRIAELAGVSVGSLYQYFGDKEALIEALVEKLAADIATGLKRLPVGENGPLAERVASAIYFGFSLLNSADGLYIELVRNWHRLPGQKVADTLQNHFLDLARLYFLKHYREHPIEDLDVRIFIIVNSTLFTMVRFVGQDNPMIGQEQVAKGLIDMILSYLPTAPKAS